MGDKWYLVDLKELSIEYLCTWDNSDGIEKYGDAYLPLDKCVNFEKDIWFELGKPMWRKHHSVF